MNLGSLVLLRVVPLPLILPSAYLAQRTGETSVIPHIRARSISRTIWESLPSSPTAAHVLAVFERACNLVAWDGRVIGVVLSEIGDGPLNVVNEGKPGVFASLQPGMPARLERGRLRFGPLEIDLANARVWEPCPDWEELRACGAAIGDRLPLLRDIALQDAPEGNLLNLTRDHPTRPESLDSASTFVLAAAREATGLLRAGWQGDTDLLRAGAARLAGLGSGLTPSGDDFLCGVMTWALLAHPNPTAICHLLLDASAPHTATLSAALLGAAARGECSAAWHLLLAALARGSNSDLAAATRDVLSHGATSGADTLAGFLWAGTFTLHPISR